MKRKMLILVGTALIIMLASMLVMGQIKHAPIIKGLDQLDYDQVECHYKSAEEGQIVANGMLDDSTIENIVYAVKGMEWTLADEDQLKDQDPLDYEFVMTSDKYITIISLWNEGFMTFTHFDKTKDEQVVRAHIKVDWKGKSIHQMMSDY